MCGCGFRPFDNKTLRQAVACAINRSAFIKAIYFGEALPAPAAIAPPMSDFWQPELPYSQAYDLEKAKALPLAAGRLREATIRVPQRTMHCGGSMLYLLLKWLHVLAAIVAVGANVTYGIWLAHASRHPEALAFTLRGIKWIDDHVANPAYGLLLLTGILMMAVVRMPLTTPWLLAAFVLYVLVVLVGLLGYTPTLRHQIECLDREGFQSSTYQALARRGRLLGGCPGCSGDRDYLSDGREARIMGVKARNRCDERLRARPTGPTR